MAELELLLSSVRSRRRKSRWGIGTAKNYLRDIESCLNGGACPVNVFALASESEWRRAIKDAEQKLVFCNKDTVIDVKSVVTNSSDFKDIAGDGVIVPKNTLMIFRNIVTTPRKDRDGDILRTDGAQPDPNMPFLLHHTPMLVAGKMLKVVDHNAKVLRVLTGVMDNECGHDAVKMIEYGVLRISHGFLPLEFEPLKGRGESGWDISKFEIMEESGVPIPSNVEAVIEIYSADKFAHPANKAWGKSLFDARTKVHLSAVAPDSGDLLKLVKSAEVLKGELDRATAQLQGKQTMPKKPKCGCSENKAGGGNEDGDLGGNPQGGEGTGYYNPQESDSPTAQDALKGWTSDDDHQHAQHGGELWTQGVSHDGWDALHGETQQRLNDGGVKSVKAFRGVTLDANHPLAKAAQEGAVVPGTAFGGYGMKLTGWSEDVAQADKYCAGSFPAKSAGKVGIVLERDVPAHDVVAMHSTHKGFNPDHKEVIARNKGMAPCKIASIHGVATKGAKTPEGGIALNYDLSCTDHQRGIGKPTGPDNGDWNPSQPVNGELSGKSAELASTWKSEPATGLTIDENAAWDGAAASERVFKLAMFDSASPNVALAKTAFLAYDSAKVTDKGSYKLPFADVIEGKLTAVAAGVRDAASRLTQTDIPADVRADASKTIDAYEKRMNPEKKVPAVVGREFSAEEVLQRAMKLAVCDGKSHLVKLKEFQRGLDAVIQTLDTDETDRELESALEELIAA